MQVRCLTGAWGHGGLTGRDNHLHWIDGCGGCGGFGVRLGGLAAGGRI